MRFQLAAAAALVMASLSAGAGAHHSFAMFDMSKEVTVKGTVKKFQWTNPHAYIQLVAKDASGNDVEYSLEMGAPMYLYARGWRPSSLKAGMRVSVTINPLRNGDPGGVVIDVTTADGEVEIFTNMRVSDLNRVAKTYFTPDPAENRRSARRLGTLEPRTRQLLELAGCIGHTFRLRTLSVIAEQEPRAVLRALLPAVMSSSSGDVPVAAVITIDALVGEKGLLQTFRAKREHARLVGSINTLRHDNARLRDHADEVDEIKALIDRIERAVSDLVEGALDRLKAAGHAIVDGIKDGVRAVGNLLSGGDDGPDPRDVQLAQYPTPGRGDRAWLDVPDELGIRV